MSDCLLSIHPNEFGPPNRFISWQALILPLGDELPQSNPWPECKTFRALHRTAIGNGRKVTQSKIKSQNRACLSKKRPGNSRFSSVAHFASGKVERNDAALLSKKAGIGRFQQELACCFPAFAPIMQLSPGSGSTPRGSCGASSIDEFEL